ncbi:hypothetical protein M408DRAFT_39181, partial [Serendipita vermifera MAFF 305830]
KNRNPLTDLIDSEEQFVALMSAIIRKVASAWSRSNFPPPELDQMFRGIEGVFKASRVFLGQLKEIGPNPSSPKALGDLLMRWVEDLEQPYRRYCESFAVGFDEWDAIQSNPKLAQVLVDLSQNIPPPSNIDPPIWTLDALFILPRTRLKYYKKLYARLLKSTNPGRSDHRLLLSATETLDMLFAQAESRLDVNVANPNNDFSGPSGGQPFDINVQDTERDLPPPPPIKDAHERDSLGSSGRATHTSFSQRLSRETAQTSLPNTNSINGNALDLERRLSTDRVLDLFTMNPKQCRLQINPPNLPFTRGIRIDTACIIYFTPRSTQQQIATTNAHIYILTDLFLVAERMSPEDREQMPPDGPDMWLSYPPLAGKHLRVSSVQEHVLQVVILRKETFYIHFETESLKDQVLHEFLECQEAGSTMANRANNGPVPPVPPPYNGPMSGPMGGPMGGPPRPPSEPSMSENGQIFPARNGSLHGSPAHPGGPPLPGPPGMGLPGMGMGPGFGMGGPPPPPPPGMGGAPFMPPPRGSSAQNGLPPQQRMQSAPPGGIPPGAPFPPFGPPQHLGSFPPPGRQPSPGAGGPMMFPPGHPGFGPPPPMGRPMPPFAGPGGPQEFGGGSPRMSMAPSLAMRPESRYPVEPQHEHDDSPPTSPVANGPTKTVITAEMRCKVFLKQQHQQWKALGSGKLKLYHTRPTDVKQLAVEADGGKSILMSTYVLTDGVERVGRTGVAVEMSDQGVRSGVVYMVQLRNETSAQGLFDSLLAGSDR